MTHPIISAAVDGLPWNFQVAADDGNRWQLWLREDSAPVMLRMEEKFISLSWPLGTADCTSLLAAEMGRLCKVAGKDENWYLSAECPRDRADAMVVLLVRDALRTIARAAGLPEASHSLLLPVDVAFLAHGRNYDVRLSTLVNGP